MGNYENYIVSNNHFESYFTLFVLNKLPFNKLYMCKLC